jgi:hypothetical protein
MRKSHILDLDTVLQGANGLKLNIKCGIRSSGARCNRYVHCAGIITSQTNVFLGFCGNNMMSDRFQLENIILPS